MYYDKAIENFAKKKKYAYETYDYYAKKRIMTVNRIIEGMTAHGKCPNKEMPALLYCPDCPMYLVKKREPELKINCDNISVTDMREILAREYKEGDKND